MSDEPSESTFQIPLLTSSSTPVDGDKWQERLKEELVALIAVRIAPVDDRVCEDEQEE